MNSRSAESDVALTEFTPEGISVEPRIVEKPAMILAGVEFNPEQYGWDLVPTAFFELARKIAGIRNQVNPQTLYGYIHDRALAGGSVDSYLASVEVSDTDVLPEGVVARCVPSALYAVFTVKGGLGKIGTAYAHMNQKWQPESGFEWASCGAIEVYDARFEPGPGCEFEIWQAVKRIASQP